VVQYLNEHLEIQKSKILRSKHNDLAAIAYLQGTITGLETFLDLCEELEKYRVPSEEEKAAYIRSMGGAAEVSQAVVMGQTRYKN
jgi:hypothetical protein